MNVAASIRDRLMNISRKEKIAFQVLILRYLHERLLYRLSVSNYADRFFLKGGNLMYAFQGLSTRPTMDIDLMAKSLSNEAGNLVSVFTEILSQACQDGVWFEADSLQVETIAQQNIYSGTRLNFMAGFHSIKQKLQIDVGFGDKIMPEAISLEYPVLLDDLPTPVILAYTAETMIAEKFHAMIFRAGANSRMKDFYDVYQLLHTKKYSAENLEQAILATFNQRLTYFTDEHELFSEGFSNNAARNIQWQAFLKKINHPGFIAFDEVMDLITKTLKPIWKSLPRK
jgi:predicted nucleotidyltransferase component of viral defense system